MGSQQRFPGFKSGQNDFVESIERTASWGSCRAAGSWALGAVKKRRVQCSCPLSKALLVIAYGPGDNHGFRLDEPDFACLADEVAETRNFVFVFGLERAQMGHHHAIQECRRIRIVEAFTKHDVPLG